MIKSIKIRNFQKHKALDLDFSPGLNVIVGSSDKGKSSIFRALYWLRYNRPISGLEGFRNWEANDKDDMEVSVVFDDCEITRKKSKGKNSYQINGEPVLDTVRTDVPRDVESLINMSYINFQRQDQALSFLQDTPGETATKIGEIVGLGIISDVLKKLNQYVSDAKKRRGEVKEEIDRINKQIAELPTKAEILKAEKTIEALENIEEKIAALEKSRTKLDASLAKVVEFKDELELASVFLSSEELVQNIDRINKDIQEKERERKRIEESLSSRESLILRKNEMQKIIAMEGDALAVFELNQKIENNLSLQSQIERSLEKTAKYRATATELENNRRRTIEEYSSMLRKYKVCPTCFSKIGDQEIKEITRVLVDGLVN